MRRLIDANALSEKIGNMKFEITHNRGGYKYCNEDEKNEWDKLDSFDRLVCDAPTVQAVEVVPVVRCKDCVNYCGFEHCKNGICDVDSVSKRAVCPDDFCSYGERREGE